LTWTEAASIPENWLTAFQALVLCCNIQKGDDVLIHAGASGVGMAAIQLSRFIGANTVTATASTEEKLDTLLAMPNGATHVANYKTQDFSTVVKMATNGRGVNIIVDVVGQSHWNKNVDSLALDGRMVMLAHMSGGQVPVVDIGPILYKRLHIQGSTLRFRSVDYQVNLIQRFKSEALEHITGATGIGPMKIYIHEVYPWTDIQEAHREMEGDKNSGKIIIEVV